MIYRSKLDDTISWSIEIDLWNDFSETLVKFLREEGVKNVSEKKAVYEYINYKKRNILQHPRKVYKSAEFCCPSEYECALEEFIDNVERGEALKKYMTDSILDANKNDDILNDWNIYHFHLTRRFREDGFAKRSDYQIFAWVTLNEMYLIQIYRHDKDFLYSTQEMIRIMVDNWPELMEDYRLVGIESLAETINDENYGLLRKAHISTLVELGPNKVYGVFGGGYSSDGSSTEAVMQEQTWLRTFRQYESIIKNICVVIIRQIRMLKGEVNHNLKIKFKESRGNSIMVWEVNNRVVIWMFLTGEIGGVFELTKE